MVRYKFTKMSRESLTAIAENAIKALADKRNFDMFTFTLDVLSDESSVVVEEPCPKSK